MRSPLSSRPQLAFAVDSPPATSVALKSSSFGFIVLDPNNSWGTIFIMQALLQAAALVLRLAHG